MIFDLADILPALPEMILATMALVLFLSRHMAARVPKMQSVSHASPLAVLY
jgi:hypothetical protein